MPFSKLEGMSDNKIKKHFVDSPSVKSIQIDEYEISFEPIESSIESARHSPALKKRYLDLLEEAQISPQKCLQKAIDLQKECRSPEIDNLLTYLYLQSKQVVPAEKLIEESYQKYPQYFFAKINYADQLLRKKKLQEFADLFPSFELKEICPGRAKYHVAEYRSFMTLMSRYHLLIKNRETAVLFYHKAHRADPAHLSVIVLEKALFGSSLWQRINKILCKLPFYSKRAAKTSN